MPISTMALNSNLHFSPPSSSMPVILQWFLVGMKSNDGLMVMIVGDDVNAAATTG